MAIFAIKGTPVESTTHRHTHTRIQGIQTDSIKILSFKEHLIIIATTTSTTTNSIGNNNKTLSDPLHWMPLHLQRCTAFKQASQHKAHNICIFDWKIRNPNRD